MEKPLEAKYKHYGSIIYKNAKGEGISVDRTDLYLYPNGEYKIDLVNSGTWEKDEDDPNKIILTASDTFIFSRLVLEYDPKWYELEPIDHESTNPGFKINSFFKYTSPL